MKISILGAGNVGRAIGGGWRAAGHEVRFGVPDPDSAKYHDLERGLVGSVAAVVRQAEIIVLATPWPATQAAIHAAGELDGTIIIDCTNPLSYSPDSGLALETGFSTSGGEIVAGWAPRAFVYKTLNQTGAEIMGNAFAYDPKPVMFVAGADEKKAVVLTLVNELGFEAINAGALSAARLLEPYAMVWISQAVNLGMGRDFAFAYARPR
ncbi:MAG: dinucleotide-binding enzyme [Rhizobiales bacterium]|nr:dinucleotide-binding enzyme [Hyphomicrobiales bacterium]